MKSELPEKNALSVQKGIAPPENVNPKYIRRKHTLMPAEYYAEHLKKGCVTTLSQAFTIIESRKPEHQILANEILSNCLSESGNSIRIGITGVPGAGKSTFIETLGMFLIERFNKKIAVLAIDPSGSTSGGSILGDKTRMEKLGTHPSAYIRPTASAGTLGGTARKTAEGIILCEAAGYDTIFVETVGVGQSEIAVKSMTDFFLMLQIAGAGDELQGIKRGITEAADAIVINKADGENIRAAQLAKTQYENALHLFPLPKSNIRPEVFTISAFTSEGLETVWNFIQSFENQSKTTDFWTQNRRIQTLTRMHESIADKLSTKFYNHPIIIENLQTIETAVMQTQVSPYEAAETLLNIYSGRP